jgi:hypothetical protein
MANRFWVGGSGTWDTSSTANWSATSGGASGATAPTTADIAFLDANSGTVDVTLGENVPCLRLTCTGFTGTLAFGANKITIAGNGGIIFTQSTTMTVTGTPIIDLSYSGAASSRTISLINVVEANAISFNVLGGSDTFAHSNIAGIKNLNFTGFAGNWNNNSGVIFGDLTIATEMTLAAGNLTRTFAGTSGTQQITTNGKTLDFPLIFNGVGGTFAFQDALTQGATRAFTITNGTVQLKDGVTSTVGVFATSGTNQKVLQSTLSGTQATLTQASGTVNASYLTIQDNNATGGATWDAYVDNFNVDAGNNDGWDFGISPIVGGNEYTYQLRSFTQPRRF